MSPSSISDLADAVRVASRALAVGAGTKPRLSRVPGDCTRISTAKLRGIVEYEPDEFTFTALAGTPVRDIAAALAERGQYLPFDPPLVEAGATLGGTVAAGLSGPGRFRFGGLRDFILGVCFVDGAGRLLRLGGKVVKNAAGFDLPKFFTGSAGRFGVLAEMTFKVFPRPAATATLKLPVANAEEMARALMEMANTRWEPDALDASLQDGAIYLRLAGPPSAIETLAREVLSRRPGELLPVAQAETLWSDVGEFRWAHAGGVLFKVALAPAQLPQVCALVNAVAAARAHISAGGNAAFVSLPSAAECAGVDEKLAALGLAAMTLRGDAPLWLGVRARPLLTGAVKDALDPQHRFPSLDE